MNITNVFTSSVGKKFVMAGTGLLLFGFVVAHLAGNLQVFIGPEELNRYGNFLQTNKEILWPARIGLLVIVGLHIWAAIQLSMENRSARPIAYAQQKIVVASYASRTMLMSGLIILAFIIYHLLHFTLEVPGINLAGRDFRELLDENKQHDVYAMMVLGFRNPIVAIFYVFAIFLLCLHLSHGLSAMFQSLGWKSQAYAPIIEKGASWVAWLIFAGYVSIPILICVFHYGDSYLISRGLLLQ
jgi:succinate dehydrogenase / fumarate reductase cytochrome b subunit